MIVERESGKKAKEPVAAITDVEIGAISEKLASAVPEQKPAGLAVIKSFFAELKVFKNPQFLSLTFAEIAASIGFLIPMYYFQSKFPWRIPSLVPQNRKIQTPMHITY